MFMKCLERQRYFRVAIMTTWISDSYESVMDILQQVHGYKLHKLRDLTEVSIRILTVAIIQHLQTYNNIIYI